MGLVKAPLRNLQSLRSLDTAAADGEREDVLWALRDVSFEVAHGETLGIIGRNGAGKSTLLKILSRITSPTRGEIRIRGRVASLLEVGTGFHPELTGRENVYMNGTILGMRKREIDRNFDEIVDFAGVERFIDTPIKRYSSGMQVRLAFAVAAHLEPEILIVDEVLAVGDSEFQKKCLGKMGDVAKGGRTVLFVSHNMDAVASLCKEGIMLDSGTIAIRGPARSALHHYLLRTVHHCTSPVIQLGRHERSWCRGGARLETTEFLRSNRTANLLPWCVQFGEPFAVRFRCTSDGEPRSGMSFHVLVRNESGTPVTTSWSADHTIVSRAESNSFEATLAFQRTMLCPGDYALDVTVYAGRYPLDAVPSAARVHVEETPVEGAPSLFAQEGALVADWVWSD
jgi:lipopolysaccharide transport system ATP-binding protein